MHACMYAALRAGGSATDVLLAVGEAGRQLHQGRHDVLASRVGRVRRANDALEQVEHILLGDAQLLLLGVDDLVADEHVTVLADRPHTSVHQRLLRDVVVQRNVELGDRVRVQLLVGRDEADEVGQNVVLDVVAGLSIPSTARACTCGERGAGEAQAGIVREGRGGVRATTVAGYDRPRRRCPLFSYQLQDAQDRVRVPALVRRIALGGLADLGSDARLELLVCPLQEGEQLAHDHADGAVAPKRNAFKY